jgi:hypothetical protein
MFAWCSRLVMTISSPLDVAAAPALRDQVDALGRAAHEDDLCREGAFRNRRVVSRRVS